MAPIFRWSFALVLLAAATALAGCDMASQISESIAHATPIAAEIEAAVGTPPQVSSATTGPILVVTVSFSEVPSLPVPRLEEIARAAVVREFHKEPTMLTIAFVYSKSPFGR